MRLKQNNCGKQSIFGEKIVNLYLVKFALKAHMKKEKNITKNYNMIFNISSKNLMSHLSAVSKVVNSKNSISILDNFLFELNGDELVITGSDSDTTLKTRLTVNNAEGKGKFAVNVKRLNELLKELPEQGLKFEINDDTLEINIYYMNGKFNFIGIDGNEFPQKALNDSDSRTFAIPAKEIVKGINQTIFAVGSEDLRAVMMGSVCGIGYT